MPGVKGRSGGARKGAGCKPGQGGGVREGAGCKPGQGGGAREGAGRKPFEPTKDQRVVAERGAAFGLTLEQIALMIVNPTTGEPIGVTTLREHFRDELDKGHPAALLSVANALYRNATQRNNVTAQIFYLKTRGKWTERLDVTVRRLEEMTDEELDAAIAAAVGDDPPAEDPAVWPTVTTGESSTRH